MKQPERENDGLRGLHESTHVKRSLRMPSLHQQDNNLQLQGPLSGKKKGKIYKDKSSICTVAATAFTIWKIDSSAPELKAANQYPTRNLPQ